MELAIAVLGLVALAVLAVRFGHDSRDQQVTAELELARRGVTWDDLAASSDTSDRSGGRESPTDLSRREEPAGARPART